MIDEDTPVGDQGGIAIPANDHRRIAKDGKSEESISNTVRGIRVSRNAQGEVPDAS